MNIIDYNRWWILRNDKLYEYLNETERQIDDNCLIFPGCTADLNANTLNNSTQEQIVDTIMEQKGSWSVVYYNKNLNKLWIGRDVFGRQSIVFNFKHMIFGVRVNPDFDGGWVEVPYGQLTVFTLGNHETVELYTYLNEYPEGVFDGYLEGFNIRKTVINKKSNLLNVSRSITSNNEDLKTCLFDNTVEATKVLLRNYKRKFISVCLSGGVDSTFIAHVVHKSIPNDMNIELVNVAFGNSEKDCSNAPDRQRAINAYKSFQSAYPSRVFRLILVNVNSDELEECRKSSISLAARPAVSVLDDSLSCVLWFAVRGKGKDYDNGEEVQTEATTCLLGSGADELLAGYARHRNRFEKELVPENVAEECENELRRLGSRNGGRDARVAAQLNKTILSPLLEDDVVSWLNSLPVNSKWDLSLPRGVGEKLLLRETVKMLGSPYDAPKQAMQFGSRMAKMSNNGNNCIKGSDKSPHLIV